MTSPLLPRCTQLHAHPAHAGPWGAAFLTNSPGTTAQSKFSLQAHSVAKCQCGSWLDSVIPVQALGFNAVRLLTSFQSVFGLSPLPQSRECASVTPSDYEAYLTDPATPVAEGATIPNLAVCGPSKRFRTWAPRASYVGP